MIYFLAVDSATHRRMVQQDLAALASPPIRLWRTPEAAQATGAEIILAVDGEILKAHAVHVYPVGEDAVEVSGLPYTALQNVHPYRPIRGTVAGGGYVIRQTKKGWKLLMIFRRGVWDLPKGKQDAGETIEQCALREVCEEVGIARLKILRPAGRTIHGYQDGGKYRVKTTYWYLMETPERTFMPQAKEGIEKVEWKSWAKAKTQLGYVSLREHIATVEPLLVPWELPQTS